MKDTKLQQINDKRAGYYIVFPSLYLESLSHRQCILMGLLNSLASSKGYCYASNRSLRGMINTSQSSLEKDLKELESKGLITRDVIRNEYQEVAERRIYVNNITLINGVPDLYIGGEGPRHIAGKGPLADKGGNNDSNNNTDKNKIIESFEEAWKIYTKKGVKKTALKSWNRLTTAQRTQALEHIPLYIANHEENKKMPYLPHFATYLNQERWTDSLPYGTDEPRQINWG